MSRSRGLSDATGYPVGAGAGGPKGSLAPIDPSSVAEGNPLRCLAPPALLRFAHCSTHRRSCLECSW
jgi:hypothetical protein